jgi:hypothetical protein
MYAGPEQWRASKPDVGVSSMKIVDANPVVKAGIVTLMSLMVCGCAADRTKRSESRRQQVKLSLCTTNLKDCPPAPLTSNTDPYPIRSDRLAPTLVKVKRDDSSYPETYRFWQGAYASNRAVTAQFRLDLSDEYSGPVLTELGGGVVDAGWAAMIRSTGKPPLRTIRITTGRPAFDTKAQSSEFPTQQQSALQQATEFCVLVAIEPEATSDKGVEYYFLAAQKATTHTLWLYVGKEDKEKLVQLHSGHYIRVDREKANEDIKPIPFPTKNDLVNHPKWLQDAIDAASTKEYPFTS